MEFRLTKWICVQIITILTCSLNINTLNINKVKYVSSHSIALSFNIHLLSSNNSYSCIFSFWQMFVILTSDVCWNINISLHKVSVKIHPWFKSKLKGINKVSYNSLSSFRVVSWKQVRRGSNTNWRSNRIPNF